MSEKLYCMYCEICNCKIITDGNDDAARNLVEIKTSPIPTGYPKLDNENNKIIVQPAKKQIKKFKCPKCGRGVRPRQIEDTQAILKEKQEIKKRVDARNEEDWSVGRKEGTERRSISRRPNS